jgi:hypothetical protein
MRVYQTGTGEDNLQEKEADDKYLILKWFRDAIIVAVHLLPPPLVNSCNTHTLLDSLVI